MCCFDHVLWFSEVSENLNVLNLLMKKTDFDKKKQTNENITTIAIAQRVEFY